jgi:hypothetical protein
MFSRVILAPLLLGLSFGTSPMPVRSAINSANLDPFTQMLKIIPASAADVANNILNYVDLHALIASRPGAASIASQSDWDAAQSDTTNSGGLLAKAALSGAKLGSWGELFFNLGKDGIDPFTIQRSVTYGPAANEMVLFNGVFNATAIDKAYTANGFVKDGLTNPSENINVWCSSQGCDKAAPIDVAAVDPANPFGGILGRKEPIALVQSDSGPGYLFGAKDYALVKAQLDALQGNGKTLGNVPDYAALAEALTSQGTLLQTRIYDPGVVNLPSDKLVNPKPAMLQFFAQSDPIPAYTHAAMAHLVKDSNQLTIIALVYDQASDAQIAANVIPVRLKQYRSNSINDLLSNVLARVHATIDTPLVYPAANGKAVLLVVLRAPIESTTPNAAGYYQASGLLYSTFLNMIDKRDIYWLTTSFPKK